MIMQFDLEIPDWANWLAQDKDGEWRVHSREPKPERDYFWNSFTFNGMSKIICVGPIPADWTLELYEILR